MSARSPLFIVGTERSGSNLLRLILNEHPSIAIPHPPHIMKELGPLEARYGDLGRDANFRALVRDAVRLVRLHFFPWEAPLDEAAVFAEAPARTLYGVKAALYDQFRRARKKERWGCKSTFVIHYVDRVLRVHPDAQFIHLVRDGRDVAVSAKRSVFNHFHPHYVGRLWAREQTIAMRLLSELPAERFLSVRYEDLLEDPPAVVRRVCAFLREDYSDQLLRYFEGADARALAGQSASWENVARPVMRDNRARYRSSLSAGEIEAFEVQAHAPMRHFGYDLEQSWQRLEEAARRGVPAARRAKYWALENLWALRETIRSLWSDRNTLRRLRKKLFMQRLRLSLRLRRRAGASAAAIALTVALAATAHAAVATPEPAASDTPAPVVHPHRRRPRYKHLVKRKPKPVVHLKGEHWTPEVRAALERLLLERGKDSAGYDPDWPPVAVFALDDVSIAHHAGEAAFQHMVEHADFKYTPDWWRAIPPAFRQEAQRTHRAFMDQGETVWPNDPNYNAWRKTMFSAYDTMCRTDGLRHCRAWLVKLLAGFSEGEAEAYMRDAIEEALREPLAEVPVLGSAGDPHPVTIRRGIRRIPEITELIGELLRRGFDVWVLSSSNQWAADAVARRYGVDSSRVVGVRGHVLNRRLRAEALDPVPQGAGMVQAVTASIGREPALAVGGRQEPELLAYGHGLRVAIDTGDHAFAARARARGWMLQPALPPGEPEAGP